MICLFDGPGSSDAEGAIASYQWDFGDGGTADEARTTHDFAQAGTYPVTLEVADGAGSTHNVTHQVAVSTSASPLSFRSGARSVANTTSPSLTVPSNVRAGDGLILFATLNITTTTVSGPSVLPAGRRWQTLLRTQPGRWCGRR